MIVTIHQPNFIPWYPFFQKMEQADLFILLGNCQFEKNGFQNRFQLKNTWNTLSVKKGKNPIIEKKYINPEYDWMKIKKRLFKYKHILNGIDPYISKNLYQTNKDIITYLKTKLNINTPLVEDIPTDLVSSERLLMLCKHYGATKYLAGQGGKDYLNESIFLKEGIEIIYQENLIKKHTIEYLNEII